MSDVTPAELRELAARAQALATDIDAVKARLRAAVDEPSRGSGFRLDEAAGGARGVGAELEETAGDLARVRSRGNCPCDWGACPEHGATLLSSGGRSWCDVAGCDREWGYDRAGLPCDEAVAYNVVDATGASGPMCASHAQDARQRLIGAVFSPIDRREGQR